MGPTLLLDKSALQCLKAEEVSNLTHYFSLNIPPILLAEILGDIDKKTKTKSRRPEISILADKLPSNDVIISTDVRRIIPTDLTGERARMTGEVLSEIVTEFTTESGERCLYLDQTPVYRRIWDWQEGKTSEFDVQLGQCWKVATDTFASEQYLTILEKEHILCPTAQSELDAVNSVNFIMSQPDNQIPLLRLFLNDLGCTAYGINRALTEWKKSVSTLLIDFSPYTAFCIRAFLLFLVFTKSDLIKRRKTNRIDIEYLYYMPFCQVFCSNDYIHKAIAPHLLLPYHTFLTGNDLKADIKNIEHAHESKNLENPVKCGPYPPLPRNEESCVFRAWRKAGMVRG